MGMMFPITHLLDDKQSEEWLLEHFHPEGLRCPKCGSRRRRTFRETETSRLITVYRCSECGGIYNLYSGTLFEKKHLRPSQVVLLLRGVAKGEPSMRLAEELGVSRTTAHYLRKELLLLRYWSLLKHLNLQAWLPDAAQDHVLLVS